MNKQRKKTSKTYFDKKKRPKVSFDFLLKKPSNEELSRMKIIRILNDDFRASVSVDQVFLSPDILKFDLVDQVSLLECIRIYNKFDEETDLLHERGRFTYAEKTIVWEIHYFDKEIKGESFDPSDIHQTERHLIVSVENEL